MTVCPAWQHVLSFAVFLRYEAPIADEVYRHGFVWVCACVGAPNATARHAAAAAAKTPDSLGTRHAGLGTRIVETLARQISAAVAKECLATGYKVTVTVPHRGSP